MEMTFFAQELKKIISLTEYIEKEKYIGNVCVCSLTENITARIEFITSGIADHYGTIQVKLINKNEGTIDTLKLTIADVIGEKIVRGNPMKPYIWIYHEIDWYAYHPVYSDYQKIAEAIDDYLSCFK